MREMGSRVVFPSRFASPNLLDVLERCGCSTFSKMEETKLSIGQVHVKTFFSITQLTVDKQKDKTLSLALYSAGSPDTNAKSRVSLKQLAGKEHLLSPAGSLYYPTLKQLDG